jgi:hypothetical protein
MRNPSIILLLLLSSVSLPAKTSAGSTSTVFTQPPASQSCPVSFSAERKPNSGLVLVRRPPGSLTPDPLAQGLQITFDKSSPPSIVRASITVHGMSPRSRAIPAAIPVSSGASLGDDATETFELGGNAGSPLLRSSIWTKRMSAITWVELTRLVHANGTIWQPSANSRCTAAPSLLVLVDAAR